MRANALSLPIFGIRFVIPAFAGMTEVFVQTNSGYAAKLIPVFSVLQSCPSVPK